MRILDEYKNDADTLPVANDIVEKFVAEKSGKGDVQYAIDETSSLPDDDFLRAEIDAWRSNPNYSVEDDNTGAHGTLPLGTALGTILGTTHSEKRITSPYYTRKKLYII